VRHPIIPPNETCDGHFTHGLHPTRPPTSTGPTPGWATSLSVTAGGTFVQKASPARDDGAPGRHGRTHTRRAAV